MIKTSQLAPNQAVVVKTIGITEVKENDVVLVGVKCVYTAAGFKPIIPGLKLIPDLFDGCDPGELIIIKRGD